jgi:hypothetical protein
LFVVAAGETTDGGIALSTQKSSEAARFPAVIQVQLANATAALAGWGYVYVLFAQTSHVLHFVVVAYPAHSRIVWNPLLREAKKLKANILLAFAA